MNKIIFEDKTAYWEVKEGILYGKLQSDIIVTLPFAKKIIKDRIAYQKQEKLIMAPAIIVLQIKYINKEARVYLSTEGIKGLSAAAIVTNTLVSKTLMKIFLVIEKPSIPTKMFDNEQGAFEWIQSFKN